MTEHVTDTVVVPVHIEQEEIEATKESMRELRSLAKKANQAIDAAIGRKRKMQNVLPDDEDMAQVLREFVVKTARNTHATPAELEAMAKVAKLLLT
ncbi:MAG: hypothetical protein IJ113_07300 [Eggerthellaceae bacterium]|nr:hypothetical protein [Eggerthellaceae bacterium]